VYHIQACLEIDVDELCRQRPWLWNEAALAVKALAPEAFIATKGCQNLQRSRLTGKK
jgi:hypothetical protein